MAGASSWRSPAAGSGADQEPVLAFIAATAVSFPVSSWRLRSRHLVVRSMAPGFIVDAVRSSRSSRHFQHITEGVRNAVDRFFVSLIGLLLNVASSPFKKAA